MASAKRIERIEQIEDVELRQQLLTVTELIDKMSSEKTPEEKKIESLMNATTDPELRSVLETRLQDVRHNGMDFEDAVEEVTKVGLDPLHVLQQGLSKWVNSKTHAAIQAQNRNDDE